MSPVTRTIWSTVLLVDDVEEVDVDEVLEEELEDEDTVRDVLMATRASSLRGPESGTEARRLRGRRGGAT